MKASPTARLQPWWLFIKLQIVNIILLSLVTESSERKKRLRRIPLIISFFLTFELFFTAWITLSTNFKRNDEAWLNIYQSASINEASFFVDVACGCLSINHLPKTAFKNFSFVGWPLWKVVKFRLSNNENHVSSFGGSLRVDIRTRSREWDGRYHHSKHSFLSRESRSSPQHNINALSALSRSLSSSSLTHSFSPISQFRKKAKQNHFVFIE